MLFKLTNNIFIPCNYCITLKVILTNSEQYNCDNPDLYALQLYAHAQINMNEDMPNSDTSFLLQDVQLQGATYKNSKFFTQSSIFGVEKLYTCAPVQKRFHPKVYYFPATFQILTIGGKCLSCETPY